MCEDAATFKGTSSSGVSYVNGGGARGAEDKVLQHNGAGTVAVKNFWASSIGKLYRSCGNCDTQYARHSTFSNVLVNDASVVAGVNGNYGDTTYVSTPRPLCCCSPYNFGSLGHSPLPYELCRVQKLVADWKTNMSLVTRSMIVVSKIRAFAGSTRATIAEMSRPRPRAGRLVQPVLLLASRRVARLNFLYMLFAS